MKTATIKALFAGRIYSSQWHLNVTKNHKTESIRRVDRQQGLYSKARQFGRDEHFSSDTVHSKWQQSTMRRALLYIYPSVHVEIEMTL